MGLQVKTRKLQLLKSCQMTAEFEFVYSNYPLREGSNGANMKTLGAIIASCFLHLCIASHASAQTAMEMMGAAGVNNTLHGQQAGSVNGARAADMTNNATQERDAYNDSRSNTRSDERRDPNEFTEEELKLLREPSKKSGNH